MLHAHTPHRLLTDERLARLAAGGDDRAFSSLYQRHESALFAYCRSITREPEDARDALQSAMASAYTAMRGRGEGSGPVRAWLFRIAHNESIDVLRRRRPVLALVETDLSPVPSAADETAQREAAHELLAEVAQLPLRQRGALVLRELHGLDYSEIAAALSVSEVNARQLVFAARTGVAESRAGRALPCDVVRDAIETGDRRAQRRRPMRAHLRSCEDCRTYARGSNLRPRRTILALPGGWFAGWLSAAGNAGSAVGGGVAEFAAPAKGMALVAIAAAVAGATATNDHGAQRVARASRPLVGGHRSVRPALESASPSSVPRTIAVASTARASIAATVHAGGVHAGGVPAGGVHAGGVHVTPRRAPGAAAPGSTQRRLAPGSPRVHPRTEPVALRPRQRAAASPSWAPRDAPPQDARSGQDPMRDRGSGWSGAGDAFPHDGGHTFAARADGDQSGVQVAPVDGGGQLGVDGP